MMGYCCATPWIKLWLQSSFSGVVMILFSKRLGLLLLFSANANPAWFYAGIGTGNM
jgi:hypothetical protein